MERLRQIQEHVLRVTDGLLKSVLRKVSGYASGKEFDEEILKIPEQKRMNTKVEVRDFDTNKWYPGMIVAINIEERQYEVKYKINKK